MLLELQGSDWSYEMLAKDMLELHDPACVTAVHQYKPEQDVKLTELKQPSLHSVSEECIQVYTEWIKVLYAVYDDREMLVTAVRTDKATAAAGQSISTNALPAYTVSHVLQASRLQYTEASATFWLHAVAGAEGISVTDPTQLLQGASSSNILSDKLDPTGQQASERRCLIQVGMDIPIHPGRTRVLVLASAGVTKLLLPTFCTTRKLQCQLHAGICLPSCSSEASTLS